MQTGLKWIYEQLGYVAAGTWAAADSDYAAHGTWQDFAQREFIGIDSDRAWQDHDNWGDSEWDNKGSIYIPTACESKKCHVHFAFHPCEGSGTLHEYDGYRELAATNEIILVYPNSYCWNGDGSVPQESGKWLTRDGLYPAAIKAMICRVTTTASEESTCPMQASDLAFTGLALLASLAFLQ